MRKMIPVLALATATSVAYMLNTFFKKKIDVISRDQLIQIIINLRKVMFSSLRQIAYAANYIHILESGIESRKIKDILMRDGSSAEWKLNLVEEVFMQKYGISREAFEQSCNYYSMGDVEVKVLLQTLKNDLQLSLEGTVETYYGPLPHKTGLETIKIYREITNRRMKNIQDKFLNKVGDLECIKREAEIEQYLTEEGIVHEREASEKVFLAMLESHYKSDSEFKQQFELLEMEFEEFIEEVKKKVQTEKAQDT